MNKRISDFKLNFAAVGVFTFLTKLVNLAILGYPAKVLGPENFGIYGYAVSIVAYVSILLLPGLSNWGAREIAIKPETLSKTFSVVFFVKLGLSVISYLLLIIIAYFAKSSSKEFISIMIYGLMIFPTALNSEWVFNGIQKMRIPSLINFLIAIFTFALIFLLIKQKSDLYIFCFIYPLSGIMNFIIQAFFLKKYHVKFLKTTIFSIKQVLKQSFFLGISVSLIIVLHYFNNLSVKYFLGSSSLAIFMVGFFFLEILSTIPTVFASIFQSRLAMNVSSNLPRAIKEAGLFAELHIILAFLFAIILYTHGHFLIEIFFGSMYKSADVIVKTMSFALLFNYAIFGYTNCLVSFGYDRFFLSIIVLACLTAILLGSLLTKYFGLTGASISIIFIDLIPFVYSLKFYKKATGSLFLKNWITPLVGFIAALLVYLVIKQYSSSLILSISAIFLTYSIVITIRILKIKKSLYNV